MTNPTCGRTACEVLKPRMNEKCVNMPSKNHNRRMEVVDLCNDVAPNESQNPIIDIDEVSAFSLVARAPSSVTASSVINLVDSDDEKDFIPPRLSKRKRQRKNSDPSLGVKPAAKPGVSDEVQICQVKQAPKTALDRVYEVIPDVDKNHAQQLLLAHGDNVDVVLSILVEKGYPKRKDLETTVEAAGHLSLTLQSDLNSQTSIDFFSTSSFEPSPQYSQEVLKLLQFEFPFLRQDSIQSWLQSHKGHYSLVRRQIEDALSGKQRGKAVSEEEENRQYLLLSKVRANKMPTPKQSRQIGSKNMLRKASRSRKCPQVTDPILSEELKSYNTRYKEWADTIETRQRRVAARKESQQAGTALECSCCFDQVAIEEMVACRDEGHLFCIDCIKGYAESQIFGNGSLGTNKVTKKPATELLCCHSDGCQSSFADEHLKKALPKKMLQKYNELQFRSVVEVAGISQSLWYVHTRFNYTSCRIFFHRPKG